MYNRLNICRAPFIERANLPVERKFHVMTKRFAPLLAAGLLTLSLLGGCSKKSDPNETAPTDPATTAPPITTTVPTGDTPAAPDPALYNRLTGEYDNTAGPASRPVAVMIGNNDKSRPQIGLATADVYLEAETEGGITRMMAIYADASRLPTQLCPIRSARSPFVLMAQSLDAIYIHAGGSEAGLKTLANSGIAAINALNSNGDTFWRDSAMRSSRGMEYSLSTGGSKLDAWIGSHDFRETSERAPFTFGTAASGDACTQLQVTFSGAQTDSFVYDSGTGRYKKYVGKLGSASAHVTTDGSPIEVTNVVILYDTKYAENETTINFNLSSGSGTLCSGGTARPIQWSRTSSGLSFKEKSGDTATFLPGKTYICLVNKANQSSTVIK